jgi:hypothetical protein
MKKFAVCFAALAAVVSASGCLSPSEQACIATQECAGEEDPAAKCTELKNDRSEDEQRIADACAAEGDAFATCFLANSECTDEVLGDADTFEACADEAEASAKCAEDNAEE